MSICRRRITANAAGGIYNNQSLNNEVKSRQSKWEVATRVDRFSKHTPRVDKSTSSPVTALTHWTE